jgi:hypothetical protein
MKKSTTIGIFIAFFIFQNAFGQGKKWYVSDAGNFNLPPWQILKFDENGQNGQVFIKDHLDWPQDILFLKDQNVVLVSNFNTNRISRFDATTGAFLDEFATGIAAPTRMKFGADGLIYVLQWGGNGRVRRYKTDGTLVDNFTSVGVIESIGMDWDGAGNLYVSSYSGKFVRKFSPTGADLGVFISQNLAGPTNIWFDAKGDLLVLDFTGNSVKRFDATGNFLGVFIANLPQGEGVNVLPNGNIVVGSGGTSSVKVYDAAGKFVADLVPPGTLGLLTPNAVVLRNEAVSTTVSVEKQAIFVVPTVGSVFQVSKMDGLETVGQIEVFNAAGGRVSAFDFSESTVWDAQNLPNGLYFLVAKLADGGLARQKILVMKD